MKSTDGIKEQLLVIRCIDGDRQAFEEIVALWQERLYRHAYHLVGQEDAAWDAVQETWVAVVKSIRKLQEPVAFGAWIYRILGARCADWVRRQKRERRVAGMLCPDSEACEPTSESMALKQALWQLPADRREILSLRYAVGYSTAEISGLLGVPEGTVKSRLHNARAELKRLMVKYDE